MQNGTKIMIITNQIKISLEASVLILAILNAQNQSLLSTSYLMSLEKILLILLEGSQSKSPSDFQLSLL